MPRGDTNEADHRGALSFQSLGWCREDPVRRAGMAPAGNQRRSRRAVIHPAAMQKRQERPITPCEPCRRSNQQLQYGLQTSCTQVGRHGSNVHATPSHRVVDYRVLSRYPRAGRHVHARGVCTEHARHVCRLGRMGEFALLGTGADEPYLSQANVSSHRRLPWQLGYRRSRTIRNIPRSEVCLWAAATGLRAFRRTASGSGRSSRSVGRCCFLGIDCLRSGPLVRWWPVR